MRCTFCGGRQHHGTCPKMKDLMQDMKKKPSVGKVVDNRDNLESGLNTTVNMHFDPFYGKEKR